MGDLYNNDPQEPRKPTHSLAKWRENHSYQQLSQAITLEQRIADLQKRIAYAEKLERSFRQGGHSGKADAKSRQTANLHIELDDLLEKQRQGVLVDVDAESQD